MFESIIGKALKPKTVDWQSPRNIILETDDEIKDCSIYKGAETYLHYELDVKPATSKEVFKKSEELWRQLRDCQLEKYEQKRDTPDYFSLDKDTLVYIVDDRNNLIDVFDAHTKEAQKQFYEKLEKFTIDITTMNKTRKFYADGKGDIVKLVFYNKNADLPSQPFTPIVVMELSTKKSSYKVYTGILIFNIFTFIPNSVVQLDCESYADLVNLFDIDTLMEKAESESEGLYEYYKTFSKSPAPISARELISLLKKVGYKLDFTDNNDLCEIVAISDEDNNAKIQRFFNTFVFKTGETAFDIYALSDLRKIFRYNELTLFDVLTILSKEFLNYDGGKITCDVLGALVDTLFAKSNDKCQADFIKKDIEK